MIKDSESSAAGRLEKKNRTQKSSESTTTKNKKKVKYLQAALAEGTSVGTAALAFAVDASATINDRAVVGGCAESETEAVSIGETSTATVGRGFSTHDVVTGIHAGSTANVADCEERGMGMKGVGGSEEEDSVG